LLAIFVSFWLINPLIIFFPVLYFLDRFQFLYPAAIADTVMAAYRPAAFRALPLFFFSFEQPFHAVHFHVMKIFNHAHVVVRTVTFIELLQPGARETSAFRAILDFTFREQAAVLGESARFIMLGFAAVTITLFQTLFVHVVFPRHVEFTDPAVHPAQTY
jgi:hypothetical protein